MRTARRRVGIGLLCSFAVLTIGFDGITPTWLPSAGAQAGSRTPGSFAVTHDGAATYSIPIWVSPGRAGVQPNLSINYSSRGANGLLGRGWTLSGLSRITRCARNLAQDGYVRQIQYDNQDAFCL